MTDGVGLSELRCPTCGAQFDPSLRSQGQSRPRADVIVSNGPPFLRCVEGHGWTVKTLTRAEGEDDRVLLGDYIGGRP